MVLPYLWIKDRVTLGPWEIISRGVFTDDDFTTPKLRADVDDLLKMYEMNGSMANRFGCVVRRTDGKAGEPFDSAEMRPIRRALVAAILDPIPEFGASPPQGWHIPTSDNALLYGHRFDGSGYVGIQYGRMVQMNVGGLQIGTEHSRIHPPAELHAPFLSGDPDPVYLDALYTELIPDTTAARRLGRAIDWLDLAWRNTTSIDDDTRIVAIYSGFEVLLDQDGTEALGKALSGLLDPGAPTTKRPIPKRRQTGRSDYRPSDITDLQWWFTWFANLRHDITHANETSRAQFEWNGKQQLFLGEYELRRAIKHTVAMCGHPDVLLDAFERIEKKIMADRGLVKALEEELAQVLSEDTPEPEPDTTDR